MEIGYKQAIRITIREKSGRPIAVLTDSKIMAGNGYEVEIERPEVDYATLEDIEKIDSPILLPRQIAGYLKCGQYSINCQAMQDPSKLGFPVIMTGSRVKIPKEGFVNFCRGKEVKRS